MALADWGNLLTFSSPAAESLKFTTATTDLILTAALRGWAVVWGRPSPVTGRCGSCGRMGEDVPMGMGPLTWACLFLAVNAGAPDVYHINQKKFAIPVKFDPVRRAEIKELLLYVS